MAVTARKEWVAGEVLTAADLVAEFANIYNNGQAIGFPRSATAVFDGEKLDLDEDNDTSMRADTDDQIDFELGGTDHVKFTTSGVFFDNVRLLSLDDLRIPTGNPPDSFTNYRVEQVRSNAVLAAASFS
jgi:hypothetical protein